MQMLDLARKDILQLLRDWKSALFLVIMPVLFTLFFGLIFGAVFGNDQTKRDPRLPVGFVNQDSGGLLSESLKSLLSESGVIRPVIFEVEQAGSVSELVAKGELAAVVWVPEGYSQAIRTEQAASLKVIADQSATSGRTAVTALDTVTGRLLGAVESAHISLAAYQERASFQDEASRQAYFEGAFQEAVSAWRQPPLKVRVEQADGQANVSEGNRGFVQSSAGMIVQFAIFGLISSAMILVLERKNGALARLMTTPISRVEVIAGHVLAMVSVVFGQEIILVLMGQFAFGVDYLRQPGAILLLLVVLALFAASLGLLIGAVSKQETQVIVLCLIAMFLFSALGGAWFPLEVTGKAFSAVGHLMPTAWTMDGFQNILVRGLGFSSVLLPAALLLTYALAFFGLAILRFKFE